MYFSYSISLRKMRFKKYSTNPSINTHTNTRKRICLPSKRWSNVFCRHFFIYKHELRFRCITCARSPHPPKCRQLIKFHHNPRTNLTKFTHPHTCIHIHTTYQHTHTHTSTIFFLIVLFFSVF